METIITIAVVLLALAFVVRRLVSTAKGKDGCSCGCDKSKTCAGKGCHGAGLTEH